MNSLTFFRRMAGYSFNPTTETREQGRMMCSNVAAPTCASTRGESR